MRGGVVPKGCGDSGHDMIQVLYCIHSSSWYLVGAVRGCSPYWCGPSPKIAVLSPSAHTSHSSANKPNSICFKNTQRAHGHGTTKMTTCPQPIHQRSSDKPQSILRSPITTKPTATPERASAKIIGARPCHHVLSYPCPSTKRRKRGPRPNDQRNLFYNTVPPARYQSETLCYKTHSKRIFYLLAELSLE